MSCGIYGIHNIITDKWYIGQSQNIEKRWAAHRWGLANGKGESIHLLRAWRKYAEESFEWIVLEECSDSELDAKEIEWINKKDAIKNGYNQTAGGGGMRGYQQSEETRRKRSVALSKVMHSDEYRKLRASLSKAMWKKAEYREKVLKIRSEVMASPEYKKKISETSKKRYENPLYKKNYQEKLHAYLSNPANRPLIIERNRKTASNKARNAKIGAAHAARYANNPELREKVSAEATARWADPEYKERLTAVLKETAQTKAVPILQVKTGIVFSSLEEAARAVNGSKSSICNCCKGKRINAYNSQWRYANETETDWEKRRKEYLLQLNQSRRHGHVPVPVFCIENGKTYSSCKEAAEELNLDPSSISKVCRGKTKSTKDYHFKYIEKSE